MKKYKDRNWLNQKYWELDLPIPEIAKLCNCGQRTIYYWLKRLNIPMQLCGKANHLRQGNHCNLSEKARQWIDGELLGDGCLMPKSKWSARFDYSSKHKEYIQYVSDTLKSFGIKQAGKIRKYYRKKYDGDIYKYVSLSYEELLPIRKRWYPNRKKIIPRDLKLTPLVLRQEMIGDGYLHHQEKGRPSIQLATCGFPIYDVKWLVNRLNVLGFKSSRMLGNKIYISSYSTKQFLDYIGKCPVECYQYKFDY